MQPHIRLEPLLVLCFALGCGRDAHHRSLRVGDEPVDESDGLATGAISNPTDTLVGSASLAGRGAAGSSSPEGVSVSIQDKSGQKIESLTLPCLGDCVEVEAVALGGNPPYVFSWEDGSMTAKRRLCPDATTPASVRVTDTAVHASEFGHEAQTVTAQLSVRVLECSDASTPDSGAASVSAAGAPAPPPEKVCHPNNGPTCKLAGGITLPDEVTVDVQGATQIHFAGGAKLPAGRYRLEYVDGCNTFGDPLLCGWTVSGSHNNPGVFDCFLVGNDTTVIAGAPGTVGAFVDPDPTLGGAFATYAECVAANCDTPPLDFDFAGGTLGVQRDGGGVLGAIDDLGGESEGGRSPTFRLSRLDACVSP